MFLTILSALHMKYVMNNITTAYKAKYFNENTVYGNPLNKGITLNIKNILCKNKRKISLLHYRTLSKEDFPALGLPTITVCIPSRIILPLLQVINISLFTFLKRSAYINLNCIFLADNVFSFHSISFIW